jgi:hypothetical protein
MAKSDKKSQGRKIPPPKNLTHQNKYVSKSRAEGEYQRLIKETQNPKSVSESRTVSNKRSVRSLDSGVLDNLGDSDNNDVPGVKRLGLWWEYNGYKFLMKGHGESGNGFDKAEIPIIQPQLVSKHDEEYHLVSCNNQSFYVKVRDKFVEVAYTEYPGANGQKQYSVRRTNVRDEILGLREKL